MYIQFSFIIKYILHSEKSKSFLIDFRFNVISLLRRHLQGHIRQRLHRRLYKHFWFKFLYHQKGICSISFKVCNTNLLHLHPHHLLQLRCLHLNFHRLLPIHFFLVIWCQSYQCHRLRIKHLLFTHSTTNAFYRMTIPFGRSFFLGSSSRFIIRCWSRCLIMCLILIC